MAADGRRKFPAQGIFDFPAGSDLAALRRRAPHGCTIREARASELLGDRGVGRADAGAVGTTFLETPGQFIVFSIKLGKVVTTAFPELNQLLLPQYEPLIFAFLCG